MAGVAQTHIYCRFAWQAWDRWHIGGALGRAWAPVTPRHFVWQAWHNLTSNFVSRGRRGTDGTGWRAWTGLGACDAAALCVAGVGQPDIHLRFTWQVWHKLTSIVVLRGRRGTDGTGWRAWTGLGARDAAALCVAGVAQTHIYCRFTWQAWHKLTSTVVLRGRRGTDGTGWRAWTGLGACDAAALCVAGVAQPDIHLRFTWQAWHKLTSTVVLRGSRGTDGTWWRAWTGLGARDAAALCVAGVAQPDIHLRFTWQAWHKLTSTVVLRGRRGTDGTGWLAWTGLGACDAAALCVAGVAQPDIHLRFTWQAWHKLTSTVVLRGRRGTDGTGWRAWTGLGARDAAALCVAGVAQTHIYCRFTWQAWHKLTSTVVLRGRRGTDGTGWRAWTGLGACDAAALCVAGVAQPDIYTFVSRGRRGTNSHLLSFCVAGVGQMALGGALGQAWAPVTPRHFAWQAWHNLTSTFVSRGRRGTNSHLLSFCVAGVGQMALGGALGRAWAPVTPWHFVWEAWHKLTSTVVSRGRRGTNSHLLSFCVAGVGQMALGGALGRAWAPVTPRHFVYFVWQVWHNLTSTFVSRGRRGTNSHLLSFCVAGVGQMALGGALGRAWAPVTPRHFAWQAWHNLTSTFVSRGRRGTNSHLLSFCVAGVGQMALGGALGRAWAPVTPQHFAWQAWHNLTSTFVSRGSGGTNSPPPSFCVAGVALMALSHTTLSHTIFHTPSFTHHLCNTPSFTPNFVTHHL